MLSSHCRSCQTTTNPSPNVFSSLTPLRRRWLVILNSCSFLDLCWMNNIFLLWICSLLGKKNRYQRFNMWYTGFPCKMLMWEPNRTCNGKSCAVFFWGRVNNLFIVFWDCVLDVCWKQGWEYKDVVMLSSTELRSFLLLTPPHQPEAAQGVRKGHSWDSWPQLTTEIFQTTWCHAEHIKLGEEEEEREIIQVPSHHCMW